MIRTNWNVSYAGCALLALLAALSCVGGAVDPQTLAGGGKVLSPGIPYRETAEKQTLSFDGVSRVVYDAADFPCLRAKDGFTLSGSFRVPPAVVAGTLFASGNWRVFQKIVRSGKKRSFFLECTVGKKTVFSRKNPFADDRWHGLTATFRDGSLAVYLDGEPIFSADGAVMSERLCVGAKPLEENKFKFPLYEALGADFMLTPGVLAPARIGELWRVSAAELPPARKPYRVLEISHGPYLLNPDHGAMTVCCVTNDRCQLTLRYRRKGETVFSATEDCRDEVVRKNVRNHAFALRGLTPGGEYEYYFEARTLPHLFYRGLRQVAERHADGTLAYNVFLGWPEFGRDRPYRFTAPDRAGEKLSMLVLPDLHNDGELMMRMIRTAGPLDFYLLDGDAVSCITDVELDYFPQLYDFFVREFRGGKVLQALRGNHEWTGRAASSFRDFFPPPGEKLYYALRLGPMLCICLDTGMTRSDGRYYTEQAEWLKLLTATEEYRSAPFRVIFTHCSTHGIAAVTPDAPEAVGRMLNGLPPELLPHLMVGGHIHMDMRLNAGEDNTRIAPFRRGKSATGKDFKYHSITIYGALKLEADRERMIATLYARGTGEVIDRFEIRRDRSIEDRMQTLVFPQGEAARK